MIDAATARALGSDVLMGAKDDLVKVLDVQEKIARIGLRAPKLEMYWDELYVVVEELKRRGAKTEPKVGKTILRLVTGEYAVCEVCLLEFEGATYSEIQRRWYRVVEATPFSAANQLTDAMEWAVARGAL